MNLEILKSHHDFKSEPEIAVVMDVFRASNTILSILSSGAEYVIPTTANTEEEVEAIRAKYPDHLFFGEHGGFKFANADYDNSPSKAAELDLTGKKVIIASTMGTKAIVATEDASETIIATFGNIDAVVDYLKSKKDVSLVGCGEMDGNIPIESLEDYFCAQSIYDALMEKPSQLGSYLTRLKSEGRGTERMLRTGLEKDLKFCLTPNFTEMIPYVDKTGDVMKIMALK